MSHATDLHHITAEIATQAVSGAIPATGAQGRLDQALAPMLPALPRVAAQDHVRQIRSFVNHERIDVGIAIHLSGGEVLLATTEERAKHEQP